MAAYDSNLFFDTQLYNSNTSWQLLSQFDSLEGGKKEEYSPAPILRGIIYDTELGFAGSHDFGPSDTAAGVSGMVGELLGIANALSESTSIGNAIGRSAAQILGTQDHIQAMSNLASRFSEKAGDMVPKVLGNAGARFTSAFDFVKVFKGTGLEIDIPPLETRIYHKVINKKPVEEVIKSLIETFVGKLIGTGLDGVDNILGIQAPPNKYMPEFRVMNDSHNVPGSFCLKYGPYTISNLLVTNFSYKLSTFRVRELGASTPTFDPKNVMAKGSSLYADVRVGLQPCTYISRNTLISILGAAAGKQESSNKSVGVLKSDKNQDIKDVGKIDMVPTPWKPKDNSVNIPMKKP